MCFQLFPQMLDVQAGASHPSSVGVSPFEPHLTTLECTIWSGRRLCMSASLPYFLRFFLLTLSVSRTPTIELVQSWYALSGWIVFITAGILLLSGIVASFRSYPLLKFVWHAFIAPIGHADQQTRLDKVTRHLHLTASRRKLNDVILSVLQRPG